MLKTGLLVAAAILAGQGLAVGLAHAESAQSGVWTYSFEPSPGGKGGLVTALSPAPSPSGDPNDPSYVIARCISGRAELLVGGAGGWGSPRRKLEVVTQIDGAPAQTDAWDVSTNGKAVFLDDKVEDFLRAIPDDGKLRFSVRAATGDVHETIFPTTGFGAVRAKIAEACGWAK